MMLGLGTAQFGFDYGLTNAAGRVVSAEVESILRLAADAGVRVLDTAASYGESETVLGRALWPGHPFRVVSKCPAVAADRIRPAHARQLVESVHRSLERLRQPSLYGLLLHRAADLQCPGAELLLEALQNLKREGLVGKVGASFYRASEIRAARAALALDIAQVPLNILDQRLIVDGTLTALCRDGTEVHARSVFLQGLLLLRPEQLPPHFLPLLPALMAIEKQAEAAGATRLELALAFAAQIQEIDVVLVGVTSTREFREIACAAQRKLPTIPFAALAVGEHDLLDPSCWPERSTVTHA